MDLHTLTMVADTAKALANHSWEYGVISEALLEVYNPQLTVFDPQINIFTISSESLESVVGLKFAKSHIKTDQDTLVDGEGVLTHSLIFTIEISSNKPDHVGSAGDPASLGVAALLIGQSDDIYTEAARRQEQTLFYHTPRFDNGAISHRVKVPELWSDSIYMFPPFLAFYGLIEDDFGLVVEAARQCSLYRDVLQQDSPLWVHIVGPETADPGLWSTGNGWAAAGMTRVLAVIKKSGHKSGAQEGLENIIAKLEDSIFEILSAAFESDRSDLGLLRNYIDDKSWFGENAGTAAIASVVYRMALLSPRKIPNEMISWAESCREAVYGNISQEDGSVSPVVNPYDSHDRTPAKRSAEAQAFVLLLEAAYRDWKAMQPSRPP